MIFLLSIFIHTISFFIHSGCNPRIPDHPIFYINARNLTTNKASADTAADLNCHLFDHSCHWTNSYFSNFTWYGADHPIHDFLMQIATGSRSAPVDGYAIVTANESYEPDANAILDSPIIKCQAGKGILSFEYWISMGVKLEVCTEFLDNWDIKCVQINPTATIWHQYAHVEIPNNDNCSLMISIRLSNFVYNSAFMKIGFGVIDNIKYQATLCDPSASCSITTPHYDVFEDTTLSPVETREPAPTTARTINEPTTEPNAISSTENHENQIGTDHCPVITIYVTEPSTVTTASTIEAEIEGYEDDTENGGSAENVSDAPSYNDEEIKPDVNAGNNVNNSAVTQPPANEATFVPLMPFHYDDESTDQAPPDPSFLDYSSNDDDTDDN